MRLVYLYIICFVCVLSCVSYKNELIKGAGSEEQARENIITDFANTYKTPRKYLKERQGKPFNVFWVFKKETKNNQWGFSISPETSGYVPLGINDRLGSVPKSYFPNNYEINKGKLFIWNDSVTPLKNDILNVLNDFGVLDSTDVKRELGLLPTDFKDERIVTIDHELKSTHYYVYKRNIGKYKKIVTNKAFGSYNSPN